VHISSVLKETLTIVFIQIGTPEDKEKIMCYLTLHQVLVNRVLHSSTRRYCWSCVDPLCGLLLKFNVNKVMFSIIYTFFNCCQNIVLHMFFLIIYFMCCVHFEKDKSICGILCATINYHLNVLLWTFEFVNYWILRKRDKNYLFFNDMTCMILKEEMQWGMIMQFTCSYFVVASKVWWLVMLGLIYVTNKIIDCVQFF